MSRDARGPVDTLQNENKARAERELSRAWPTPTKTEPAVHNPTPGADRRASYRAYRNSLHWRFRRARARALAGGRCQICASYHQLDTHHNNYERLGRERDSDLVVLCRECHERHHGKLPPAPAGFERDWEAEIAEAVRKAADSVRAELLGYEWDGIDDRWIDPSLDPE